jgi:glyceraldehyde-3-phosphate dehydrogenase (NADP+)
MTWVGQDSISLGKLIDQLANQICRVNLNTQCQRVPDVYPFTGRKDSAEGTLSARDTWRAFSIRSMVAAKQDPMGNGVVKLVLDSDASQFLSTDFLI